jgi:hypothetical protein
LEKADDVDIDGLEWSHAVPENGVYTPTMAVLRGLRG